MAGGRSRPPARRPPKHLSGYATGRDWQPDAKVRRSVALPLAARAAAASAPNGRKDWERPYWRRNCVCRALISSPIGRRRWDTDGSWATRRIFPAPRVGFLRAFLLNWRGIGWVLRDGSGLPGHDANIPPGLQGGTLTFGSHAGDPPPGTQHVRSREAIDAYGPVFGHPTRRDAMGAPLRSRWPGRWAFQKWCRLDQRCRWEVMRYAEGLLSATGGDLWKR